MVFGLQFRVHGSGSLGVEFGSLTPASLWVSTIRVHAEKAFVTEVWATCPSTIH